jgi:hypothetical protein
MYFEPIVDLKKIAITGWEALARDPESLTAPIDLFDAAELSCLSFKFPDRSSCSKCFRDQNMQFRSKTAYGDVNLLPN